MSLLDSPRSEFIAMVAVGILLIDLLSIACKLQPQEGRICYLLSRLSEELVLGEVSLVGFSSWYINLDRMVVKGGEPILILLHRLSSYCCSLEVLHCVKQLGRTWMGESSSIIILPFEAFVMEYKLLYKKASDGNQVKVIKEFFNFRFSIAVEWIIKNI